jgi:hypothetical protein
MPHTSVGSERGPNRDPLSSPPATFTRVIKVQPQPRYRMAWRTQRGVTSVRGGILTRQPCGAQGPSVVRDNGIR